MFIKSIRIKYSKYRIRRSSMIEGFFHGVGANKAATQPAKNIPPPNPIAVVTQAR